jgi:hypothetical protein
MSHWPKAVATILLAWALAALPAHAETPVKLAVFIFELDDFSPALSAGNENPADAAELARVTDEVRDLFKNSGRYDLIAVEGVDAPAAKTHTLRDCNGCEAPLARQLGAEQSLIGVVKRISRMEYQVRFQLRDAQTGAMIAEADSGLRMGAMDSWHRGAVRLVKDRLLRHPS